MKPTSRIAPAAALCIALSAPLAGAGSAPRPLDLDGASWIWASADSGNPAASVPAGTRYFRVAFDVPAGAGAVKAEIALSVDNLFELYLNGANVGRNDAAEHSWRRPREFDVTKGIAPGRNVVAVEATNTVPGPAGLIAKLVVKAEGVPPVVLVSDASWKSSGKGDTNWQSPGFDDSDWRAAKVAGPHGCRPWGKLARPAAPVESRYAKEADFTGPVFEHGIVFVRGYLPFTAHDRNNYVQRVRGTRAYFECDPPSPAALGRELMALVPFRPDGELRTLADAEGGVIGSPSVSFDGLTVYFSMARKGEAYFHVWRVSPDGTDLRQVTRGPFHDFDPAELPGGRIAFSSTRLGSREEYHAVFAFSIFSCEADGGEVRPITRHIVGDREATVTSEGSLAFIRCDNFLERAKVETQIHRTRPDGTGGVVVLGPARKAIRYARSEAAEANSNWLRKYGFGSPAALPDGRVAAISKRGPVISYEQAGRRAGPAGFWPHDFSPLPGGRLLCTGIHRRRIVVLDPEGGTVTEVLSLGDLKLPRPGGANASRGYSAASVHSAVHLGPRVEPPARPSVVRESGSGGPGARGGREATGYLYCQNALNTRHLSADLARAKAVRVYEGRPFSLCPTKHIYIHIGVEAVELGTTPLAPDGSFYVEVPADRALALQAVDAEGRSVVNELTWIYVRPGEKRSCRGCHTPPEGAPPAAPSLAERGRPLALLGGGRPHRFRGNNGANGGVLNLQLDKFREVANIDLYTQPPLTPERTDVPLPAGRLAEVERLCRLVRSGGDAARLSSIRRLAVLRKRTAVPDLCAALAGGPAEVRAEAAVALAACGDRGAVPPLLDALAEAHPAVAQGADMALAHLTGHAAGFNAYSPGREGEAAKWRTWIAANKWDAVEKGLVARLASSDPVEVHLAVEALGHVGGEAARRALRDYLERNVEGELRLVMAVMRALGYLGDGEGGEAVPLLARILDANVRRKAGRGFHELGFLQRPVYLAATAAEALGRIGTPDAARALRSAFARLLNFWDYSYRTGEHDWLMGCNASAVHYRILEAFDAMGTRGLGDLTAKILLSVPIDTDRALLFGPDGYELLVSRVVQRSGRTGDAIETCLLALGDRDAKPADDLIAAVTTSPPARSTKPLCREARAAQVLSVVALSTRYAGRIRASLQRYRAMPPSRKRSWTCFFLVRTLGKVRDVGSVDVLLDVIEKEPPEAALGLNTPPTHILYKAMKPFYRATAAHALGEIGRAGGIGGARAVPALLRLVTDLDNAPSVRRRAAVALGGTGDASCLARLREIAEAYPEYATRRALREAVREIESRAGTGR